MYVECPRCEGEAFVRVHLAEGGVRNKKCPACNGMGTVHESVANAERERMRIDSLFAYGAGTDSTQRRKGAESREEPMTATDPSHTETQRHGD